GGCRRNERGRPRLAEVPGQGGRLAVGFGRCRPRGATGHGRGTRLVDASGNRSESLVRVDGGGSDQSVRPCPAVVQGSLIGVQDGSKPLLGRETNPPVTTEPPLASPDDIATTPGREHGRRGHQGHETGAWGTA